MRAWLARSAFAPWAGLYVGALAWWAHHQLGSSLTFLDCRLGGPVLVSSLAVACGLASLAGGWASWVAREGGKDPGSRVFAGYVGAGAAAIFLFAIMLQTAAGLIIPGCYG